MLYLPYVFFVISITMSAATRLRTIAGAVTTFAAVLSIANTTTVREYLSKHLSPQTSKHFWRTLAIIFALLNFKNLPFLWHYRVFRGIFYQLYLQPSKQEPRHLFAPMITSSYNTIYDCDYNFHKSNGTYFGDLDVARAHYVGCLIRTGLARLNRGGEEGLPKDTGKEKGKYIIALGGVSCFFRRQIEPLQQFETFTRLLSWDKKWIYIVSHIVRKGAIKPKSYVFQPWKKSRRRLDEMDKDEADLQKHILATSVARYVFKKGRLTINPEIVLERSRLLPPRPAGVGLPPRAEALSNGVTPALADTPATPAINDEVNNSEAVISEASSRLGKEASQADSPDDDWTWDDMEKERLHGLKIAGHFDALSAAQDELRADEVLGQYGDYW